MNKYITITARNGKIPIERRLYRYVFENSIHCEHPTYLESLKKESITLSELINLCRTGNFAYALFFGSYNTVTELIDKETKVVYRGFDGSVNVAIRGRTIKLNTIRLIVKDIKNKQNLISKYVTAPKNHHVKFLASTTRPIVDQAECIIDLLNIDMDKFRSFKNKSEALWYLIERLEDNNIFVSFEAMSNMPQSIRSHHGLTGIYIRDKKFPFLFVCSEGLSNSISIPGRKIFTLFYLTACLFKGESKLVSFDKAVNGEGKDEIFSITEEILMPREMIPEKATYTLEDLTEISTRLNVTEMAILVRLRHIGYFDSDRDAYNTLYGQLSTRYAKFKQAEKSKRESTQKEFRINPVQNIILYQGKAFLRILKSLQENGKIRRREINRQLSYGKRPADIEKIFSKV